jgi:3-oxoacyl-[acyl-carrier-protein] synthase-1
LGEAAATMIFGREISDMRCEIKNLKSQISKSHISLLCGAIRNDANHISAPSRTGEGSFRALKSILQNIPNSESQISNLKSQISNPTSHISNPTSQISFINAHGTSTPYNDAAEVNAIVRAELEHVPVNSLKAFFGHTLGAAGVVETIISMQALSEGIILPTLNFAENEQVIINDKPYSVNIAKEIQKTDKRYFIKMLSGFGGCNAALLYKLHGNED